MKITKKHHRNRSIEPYLFIAPTVVIFVFVLLVPLYNLFKYSFGDSNIIEGFKGWNSFSNYKYLKSTRFFNSILVTLRYVFFSVLGIVISGLFISLALNKPLKGRGLYRSLMIIPWIVPHAFAAVMWSWVLNPQFGFLNQLLVAFGLIKDNLTYLSLSSALITVTIVRIWQGTPFMIMSLLSALQTIPDDIVEASQIDGVNLLQQFHYITFPYIKPVLVSTTIIISAWTMQIFDTVYIMTGGGPVKSTQLIAIEIYQRAFQNNDLGTASAISVVVLVFIIFLSLLNLRGQKGEFN